MAKEDIEIIIVADSSGSMASIKDDSEGGTNAFLDEQKTIPGGCKVSLITFNDRHTVEYTALPIKDVPKFVIKPRGGTALLDTIGHTINAVTERFADVAEEERPGKVVFVIVTDGQENTSKEFNSAQVKDMIEHQKTKSWDFIYLGANQDAFAVGKGLGISQNAALNYVPSTFGTQALYRGLSNRIGSSRVSAQSAGGWADSSISYSQQEYNATLASVQQEQVSSGIVKGSN